MRCKPLALKVLGLSMAVSLAMIAVVAATAHAEGKMVPWKINEVELKGSEKVTGEQKAGSVAKFLVPGLKLEISCEGRVVEAEITNSPSIGGTKGTILFLNCFVLQKGVKLEVCEVGQPEKVKGEGATLWRKHITSSSNGLLFKLSNGNVYFILRPLTGQTFFTTIQFYGEECPLSGTVQISGATAFSPVQANVVTQAGAPVSEKVEKEINEEKPEGGSVGIFYGKEPARIEGEALVKLAGVNEGKPWGAK